MISYTTYGLGSAGFAIVALIVFVVLQALNVPSGNFLDWVVGVASFWWLLTIVTLPWNVCFEAQEVISEAKTSQSKGITVDPQQVKYARQVVRWSLIVAIALHGLSAIAFYFLAATGIGAIGYVSSAAALLFTGLRPAIRAYLFLAARLRKIRREISYPREDVVELRQRVFQLEANIQRLDDVLDLQNPQSWAAKLQQETEASRRNFAQLRALLEQFQAETEVEHQRLAKEAKNAIAQLTEDSQVLGHVREIIQFFKTA